MRRANDEPDILQASGHCAHLSCDKHGAGDAQSLRGKGKQEGGAPWALPLSPRTSLSHIAPSQQGRALDFLPSLGLITTPYVGSLLLTSSLLSLLMCPLQCGDPKSPCAFTVLELTVGDHGSSVASVGVDLGNFEHVSTKQVHVAGCALVCLEFGGAGSWTRERVPAYPLCQE